MENSKSASLGWVVAAAALAVMVGTGFQAASTKTGIVDVAQVYNNSDFKKAQEDRMAAFVKPRRDVMDFVDSYRAVSPDQANRLRALWTKETLADPEKAELEKLKKTIQDADAQLKVLQTKTAPTPAESATMSDLSAKTLAIGDTLPKWQREMEEEIQNYQVRLRGETMDRVQKAIKDTGTKQGFTIVFSSDTAPFGANDMTADALKAINAQK